MAFEQKNKEYPVSTPEVAKMFGLLPDEIAADAGVFVGGPGKSPVKDLPIVEAEVEAEKPFVGNGSRLGLGEARDAEGQKAGAANGEGRGSGKNGGGGSPDSEPATAGGKTNLLARFIKNAAPYAAVFAVAVFMYIFFFSEISFSSLAKPRPKPETPRQTALAALQKNNMEPYSKWIAGFYYDVSDQEVLDPEADNSGNGLSNFHKFLLNLNPKSYDTIGLGMADSEALAAGINPLTGNRLTERQKDIIDRYFDMEIIMNRLALAHLHKSGQVAGASLNNYRSFDDLGGLRPGSANTPEPAPAAIPAVQSNPNPNPDAVDINTEIPARLEIPSLGINVPIIWTKDPKNFDKDLQSGVVHYPGTALPGQIGTTYISGHSSNYAWARGNYNQVFAKLGDLADNTSFKVTVVQKNGKDAVLHYVVAGRGEYDPKDQAQFRNSGQSVVALSTCWPIGSTAKRLVVFGQLTQVVKQ